MGHVAYERVTSHMNESRRISMSHVTHINESRHISMSLVMYKHGAWRTSLTHTQTETHPHKHTHVQYTCDVTLPILTSSVDASHEI